MTHFYFENVKSDTTLHYGPRDDHIWVQNGIRLAGRRLVTRVTYQGTFTCSFLKSVEFVWGTNRDRRRRLPVA